MNKPFSFRLSRLSLAIALVPLSQLVTAEQTLLGPIVVEGQAEEALLPGASRVDTDTLL